MGRGHAELAINKTQDWGQLPTERPAFSKRHYKWEGRALHNERLKRYIKLKRMWMQAEFIGAFFSRAQRSLVSRSRGMKNEVWEAQTA